MKIFSNENSRQKLEKIFIIKYKYPPVTFERKNLIVIFFEKTLVYEIFRES